MFAMRCLFILPLMLTLNAVAQKMVKAGSVPATITPLVPAAETIKPDAGQQNVQLIPFNRVGNLIIIQATADTTTGNFILDTGAPGLVLNLTYFRQYRHTEAEDRGSVSGAVTGAVQTTVNKFNFGGFIYKNVDADMISLGHIEDRKGIKILGLMGVSFFRDCELMIDYEQSLIHLYRITKKESNTYKSKMLDSAKYDVLNFDVIDNKIIAYVKLGERKMKFFIDTGAESNILDSRLPNKVFESMTITGRTKIVGTGNKTVEALYGNLRNMKVGNQDILPLPFVITNLESACISEVCCIDGILGFNFFAGKKVGFNFIKREMYLWR